MEIPKHGGVEDLISVVGGIGSGCCECAEKGWVCIGAGGGWGRGKRVAIDVDTKQTLIIAGSTDNCNIRLAYEVIDTETNKIARVFVKGIT